MADYDVFNGDADGICALVQLRQAQPRDATLITGVKRDISLLKQVSAQRGDRITVLDIALEKNIDALNAVLAAGAEVFYVDHHFPGDIPQSPQLATLINEAADVCTSILINGHLNGAFAAWAVVGAFGDNLRKSAEVIARKLALKDTQIEQLENLGIYINYNGYGSDLDDLHFKPDVLYRLVSAYANPLDFIGDSREHFQKLEQGYHDDMAAAQRLQAHRVTPQSAVFILPDEPWARRVSGVYSNDLTNQFPERAHAVLTEKASGNFLVSVRAPLTNKQGAARLCKQFPTGGGREAAAGINDLPVEMLAEFIDKLQQTYN
ncbi:MAG: DHH family phosphoesterase [Porticoccaceae bacterium]|nr:DHH family phosphoesterase [Porticoccaceae bacterium]